jgi:SNF2 family DNA or RNA helicase
MQAGYKFNRIDGTMQQSTRTHVLKQFEESIDISVILLSLHAASVGLNMTFANHVVLLDNWWNPTVEDQAVDRAHRLGQTKTVVVHNIVLDSSIEQTVLSLANRKRLMISDILTYVGKGKKSKQVQDLDFLFQGMQHLQSTRKRKADDPYLALHDSDLVRSYDSSSTDDGTDSDFS